MINIQLNFDFTDILQGLFGGMGVGAILSFMICIKSAIIPSNLLGYTLEKCSKNDKFSLLSL